MTIPQGTRGIAVVLTEGLSITGNIIRDDHRENDDVTLQDESPGLPDQHPDGFDCGLIGAFGLGWGGPTGLGERTSWGRLKLSYR